MWIEVLPNNKEDIKKFTDALNGGGCGQFIEETEEKFIHEIKNHIDCHAYYYEDNDFILTIMFKQDQEDESIIKCYKLSMITKSAKNMLEIYKAFRENAIMYLSTRPGKKILQPINPETITHPVEGVAEAYNTWKAARTAQWEAVGDKDGAFISFYDQVGLKVTKFENYWQIEKK